MSATSSALRPGASLVVPGVFSIGPGATMMCQRRKEETVRQVMVSKSIGYVFQLMFLKESRLKCLFGFYSLPLTLILYSPHSKAKLLVMESIALFAALACV